MVTADLYGDVVKYIVNDITMSCRRLGIDTVFYIKDYGHNDERLIGTSFQTMPVIFKEIHLEGSIYLEDDTDCVVVTIFLQYKCKTFCDVENVHPLGEVVYVVDKGYTSKKIRDISKYIHKRKGIAV